MRWAWALVGVVAIADATLTLLWGRRFLRWQRQRAPGWYHPLLDALLALPEGVLRVGAALELGVGSAILWKMGRSRP